MLLTGFSTRNSDIVWSVESNRPHKAIVEVAGTFPVADIQQALLNPKLKQKYRREFERVLRDHPNGKLPINYEFYNYCVASALSQGIATSNANVDFKNANGDKIGTFLGSRAVDFKGKQSAQVLQPQVAPQPPQLPAKPKPKPRPKSVQEALLSLEKFRDNISDTRHMTSRQTRLGQGPWANAVKAANPRCVITGVAKANMLEAAHIKPHALFPEKEVSLNPNNGFMLLRSLHPSFDAGEWSINKDARVVVSSSLSIEELADLAKLGLRPGLQIAQSAVDAKVEYLDWHYNNIFKK